MRQQKFRAEMVNEAPSSLETLRLGWRRCWTSDVGAATAEYAIATMAAVGFASLLVVILKGDVVRGLLTDVITGALHVGG